MARDYGKGNDNKVLSPLRSAGMIRGGPANGSSGSPPRGGSVSYPKGSGFGQRKDWDPMRKPASTYGLKGI